MHMHALWFTSQDQEALEYERMLAAFEEYDGDDDGCVTVEELAKTLVGVIIWLCVCVRERECTGAHFSE